MDIPTRRLNSPDEFDAPDDPGAPTRRLDQPAPDLPDEGDGPPCIRCDTPMLATTLYTLGGSYSELRLFMHGSKSSWRKPTLTTAVGTLTCPNCGYTELRVGNLAEFATMIEALRRDPRSR
jgi:hypothetical protein